MEHRELVATARITGVWYLLLAIFGVLGFLIFHPLVFITGEPEKTLINLTGSATYSRIRLVLELAIISSQALSAVWFFRLFREINTWAAFAIGGWGLMNAAAIMLSAIAMGVSIEVAGFEQLSLQEKIVLIQLLSSIMSKAWIVGGLFFGLWLIPMGHVVITSGRMPLWMGRILVIGGVGYILNTFLNCSGIANSYVEMTTIPATIGEFWIIGYLLIYGIRPEATNEAR